MLSFEFDQQSNAIQILCDEAGLDILVGALERVRSEGHLHLRAPSAGGRELSDVTPFGVKAISEVIITTGGD